MGNFFKKVGKELSRVGNRVSDNFSKLVSDVVMGDLAGFANTVGGGSDSSVLGHVEDWWDATLFDKTFEGMIRHPLDVDKWFNEDFRTDAQETFSGKDNYAQWLDQKDIDAFNHSILPVIGSIAGNYYFGPVGAALGRGGGEWFSRFLSESEDSIDWGDLATNSAIAGASAWAFDAFSGGETAAADGATGVENIVTSPDYAYDLPVAQPVTGSYPVSPDVAVDLPAGPPPSTGSYPVSPDYAVDLSPSPEYQPPGGLQQLIEGISTDEWLNLAGAAAAPFLFNPLMTTNQPQGGGSRSPGMFSMNHSTPYETGLGDPTKMQKASLLDQKGPNFNTGKVLSSFPGQSAPVFPSFDDLYMEEF
jgi:hypothetical protein